MIRITIWNEFVQEQIDSRLFDFMHDWGKEGIAKMQQRAKEIREVHHGGAIHDTLKGIFEEDAELEVRHIATLEMPECGLTDEVLQDTDVMVWWAHIAQEHVPDDIVKRVQEHVLRGMGILFLHSAHMSKPMKALLGTSCTLRWREGDCSRMWNVNPSHPIARGVSDCVWLEHEEMYGEFFDIPKPDDVVFISSFGGGEVMRSGCCWNRGYGRIFYFQPGHETEPSYFHPEIRLILRNAVHWAALLGFRRKDLKCLSV